MIPYATLAILIIFGSLSKIYKRWIDISLGFELKTFFTIVIAYELGFYIAFTCAAIMIFLSAAAANRIPHFQWIIVKVVGYAAVSASALYFGVFGLKIGGLLSVVILNLIYVSFNFIFGNPRYQDLVGNILNIIITFILVASLGNSLAALL